jgi:hypothetical protein
LKIVITIPQGQAAHVGNVGFSHPEKQQAYYNKK